MEIERKFLVAEPPADVGGVGGDRIEQGYLALDDGLEVRVRRRAGRATLTIKHGAGLVRVEEELSLGRDCFERLWPLTDGRRVEKVRRLVPVDGATVELDVYGGGLAGLVVAEVEFDSVEASQAFAPPAWLGEEVTGDERYANRALACDGAPRSSPGFQLGSGETAAAGLRRIARERLDRTIGALDTATPEARGAVVHSTRKSLKRLRSLVRLARDELGETVYRQENAALRDIGRRLSGARDSQVMVETLDALRERHADALQPRAFAGVREALVAEHEVAQRRLAHDADVVPEILGELRELRHRVASWPLAMQDATALTSGFERVYRRGRSALAAAGEDAHDEALHDLRKRVKDLWYVSEIMRPAAPTHAKELAERSSRLSDVIGEDHDLAVLRLTADRLRDRMTAAEYDELTDLIDRRRARLQGKARKQAARLYGRKPAAALRG